MPPISFQKHLDPCPLICDHVPYRRPGIGCLHVCWCCLCEKRKDNQGLIRVLGRCTSRGVCSPAWPQLRAAAIAQKQSGALSHLITLKPGAPFFCCYCHACPLPLSCQSASPCPLWKCANQTRNRPSNYVNSCQELPE